MSEPLEATVPAGPERCAECGEPVDAHSRADNHAALAAHPVPAGPDRTCLDCGGLGFWTASQTDETFDCSMCGGSGEVEAAHPVPAVESRPRVHPDGSPCLDASKQEGWCVCDLPAVDEDRERLAAILRDAFRALNSRQESAEFPSLVADALIRAGVALSTGDEP